MKSKDKLENKILSKINDVDSEKVKTAFKEILKDYLTPAFGSISKRDFDILFFMKLQELGVIDTKPEIYELVSELRVTRAKARNLLYEANLRNSTEDDLEQELKALLENPVFLKDGDKIAIEVENPYLVDHLRFRLKKLKHISDGSFSPELVKLTIKAYLALFEECFPNVPKKKVIKAFVDIGAMGDTSFSGIMTSVLTKLGKKVADDAGGELASSIGKYLQPILNGNSGTIKELYASFFEDDKNQHK